jgi:hypothetical protein
MRLKILGVEAALTTSASTASTIGGATEVRVFHAAGGNTPHLVSITDGEASPTTVATFSITPGESLVIRKLTTQKMFAANTDVKAVAVSYQS